MSADDLIFQALNGRPPTMEERLHSLNSRRGVGGRWIDANSQEAKDSELERRRVAAVEQLEDAAFRARVAHLDSWWDVRAAHRIHGRLDRRWLGSLRVSRETETLMYVSWLCKAASISGKDAAWVRESVDSRTWYRKYQAARKCRYSKDRPFDLAPGQDWRQHR